MNRYAVPSIGGGDPFSPLMTWWLLLYTFSILARYQPRKWIDVLNFDTSKYAASVGYALDVAMVVIPQLVLAALDRHPVLLAKPARFGP